MLTFLTAAVNSVGGVEILTSAVYAAIQLDIAVLYFSRKEIYKWLKAVVQAHIDPIVAILDCSDYLRLCRHHLLDFTLKILLNV